jgi:hypothetical protein
MDEFTTIILEMMQSPPDPNLPVPLANQKGVIFGVTIPFHVRFIPSEELRTRLTVAGVVLGYGCFSSSHKNTCRSRPRPGRCLRGSGGYLQPRIVDSISREYYTPSTSQEYPLLTTHTGTEYGMGQHLVYVLEILQSTMIWLYVTNAAYHTTTVFIKASLLLQYLRMFREGIRRKVCIVLFCLVATWGLLFSFAAWVPCFPISGFWDRTNGAKCYGYGNRTVNETKYSILSFATTNMVFDIAIFLVPLTEYLRQDLRRKQILAMTGLFALGFM